MTNVTLSALQDEILRGLAEGKFLAEIAQELGLSYGYIRNVACQMYHAIGVTHASAAVAWWQRENTTAPKGCE